MTIRFSTSGCPVDPDFPDTLRDEAEHSGAEP